MKGNRPMEKANLASSYFSEGYACSQSVLLAFAEDLGLAPEQAIRIASGFGGGMGRTGQTCGAVSGAAMVLGLAFGGSVTGDRPAIAAAKEAANERVRQFFQAFSRLHGSLECNSLLCVDISTPEGRSQAREQGKFSTLCPALVADAARITQEILDEAEKIER
jgi:C_GCAxxG_C_C family probable redox protein